MWGWLYIAVGAFAATMTWAYAVREQAIVFSSVAAALAWALLSITPEIILVDGNGDTVTMTVGPLRWLLAGLALLSFVALAGAIVGVYPEESHPEQQFSEVK